MNIPGYTIRRRLGAGGQAVVYLALQESLQRLVALKVLHPLHSESAEFTARFLNEARILANLGHSNVITIHDIGVEGELHYLSMELVEGGDLKRRMRDGLSIGTTIDYLIIIADCLATAHAKHIVHRDIKPGNVLFRGDGTLLLTDFGIAKRLDDESDLTLSGTTLGSPHYLSPEQAQGRPLDGRADIYSLGAMAFEMLCGRKPYAGKSEIDTIFRHINAPVPKLPGEFAQFQPLIDRTMAKSPDDRFESARAVADYLQSLRASLGDREQEACGMRQHDEPAGVDDDTEHLTTVSPAPARRASSHRGTGAILGIAALMLLGAWLVFEQSAPHSATREIASTVEPTPSRAIASAEPRATASISTAPPSSPETPSSSVSAAAPSVPIASAASPTPPSEPIAVGSASARSSATEPTAPSDMPTVASRVEPLLDSAELALAELRLTRPRGHNAQHYYREVLSIEPDNVEARNGLGRIANRYADLAQQALDRNRATQAQKMIARGRAVDADNPRLLAIERQLATARREQAAIAAASSEPEPRPEALDASAAPSTDTVARAPATTTSSGSDRDGDGREVRGETPRQLWRRVQGWFD